MGIRVCSNKGSCSSSRGDNCDSGNTVTNKQKILQKHKVNLKLSVIKICCETNIANQWKYMNDFPKIFPEAHSQF